MKPSDKPPSLANKSMVLLNTSQMSDKESVQHQQVNKTEVVLRESHSHSVLQFHNTSVKEPLRLHEEEEEPHQDSLDDPIEERVLEEHMLMDLSRTEGGVTSSAGTKAIQLQAVSLNNQTTSLAGTILSQSIDNPQLVARSRVMDLRQ